MPARAFDPLCASGAAAAATQLVALYPPGNFHDADSARQLGARLPDMYRLPCSGGYHNIFHTMMGTRGESDFLQDLFNPDFDLDGFCIEEYRKRTDPMEWQ
ncbi:MAG: hypothetical protein GKR99_07460 [Rhodobacteraceae bacterium]|nr:hypothetical protein [Paracoccaceae bacterium]